MVKVFKDLKRLFPIVVVLFTLSCSEESTNTLSSALKVGDSYQGGIIAYIYQPGEQGYIQGEIHGIIAAPTDQSNDVEWGCLGKDLPGSDNSNIGSGKQNTLDIINGCNSPVIAARICSELVLNGYSDWYLPSIDELGKVYQNRYAIGGFSTKYYWSSTEGMTNNAWYHNFEVGSTPYFLVKNFTMNVRAVRSF